MHHWSFLGRSIFLVAMTLAVLCTVAQAAIRMGELPLPPPGAKLRVFVLPLTEGNGPRGLWQIPHQDYARNMSQLTEKFLDATGIYEVVPEKDIHCLLGDQAVVSWQWRWNDYTLARKAGRALYADYLMILERSYAVHLKWQMMLINMETGKLYEVSDYVPMIKQDRKSVLDQYKSIVRTSYRQIFSIAKSDMLATAIRKGRSERPTPVSLPDRESVAGPPAAPPADRESVAGLPAAPPADRESIAGLPAAPPADRESVAGLPAAPPADRESVAGPPAAPPAVGHIPPSAEPVTDSRKMTPSPPATAQAKMRKEELPPMTPAPDGEKATAQAKRGKEELPRMTPAPDGEKTTAKENELKSGRPEGPAEPGKFKLVVYDFEANESLKVAALILVESLREELVRLGRFTLINRENIVQVLQELKLQQSGFVDEVNAARMGKWLAASDAVTGRFNVLGNTCLLQAKLTDITTMVTLAMKSLKCKVGREEELLDGMAELARQLSEARAR